MELGDIYFGFTFGYEVQMNENKTSGRALGGVLMEQTAYFTKQLIIQSDYLEW